MKLGSLFDGAGTFPLAASLCGITPCWASEIETFPINVTTKRFPQMKHLGDITKINGENIEPVDIITFGSPCQDLSIAGKRVGLQGDRSNLFMEAIRIIKEMRGKTNGKYPRYAIWENVPGAFSSNEREDFRIVLEEFCKIKDKSINVPKPKIKGKNEKWRDSGLLMGDNYSIAWRVLDAQYWGVPQKRRRIFLVADFNGERAGKILFERNCLSRNFKESCETWKGTASNSIYSTNQARQDKLSRTQSNGNRSDSRITLDNKGKSIKFIYRKTRHPRNSEEGQGWEKTCISDTLNVFNNSEIREPNLIVELDNNIDSFLENINEDYDVFCASNETFFQVDKNKSPTLKRRDYITPNYVCIPKHKKLLVRRLTPTEYGKLQGMPDWWCEDVPHLDSVEYKMWGNGMALPCALYIMEGITNE